jgi:hypothetical protein
MSTMGTVIGKLTPTCMVMAFSGQVIFVPIALGVETGTLVSVQTLALVMAVAVLEVTMGVTIIGGFQTVTMVEGMSPTEILSMVAVYRLGSKC